MSTSKEGSSTGRISAWDKDLDNPAAFVVDITTKEVIGGAGPSKTKKSKTAHDKDPTYPPARYTTYAHEACLQWYEEKSVQYLERKYLRNKEAGIQSLKDELEEFITRKCKESSDYADVDEVYFNQWQTWIGNCLQTGIFNTKKLMLELRPIVPGFGETDRAQEFREKMDWWQIAAKRLSRSEARGMGWQTDALKAAFTRDSGSCIMWVYSEAKVVPLTGFDRQGGYAKVRKVRIEGMSTIPAHVHFAGKLSKQRNKRDARVERSVEALVCPLNHPAIIKFLAVHDQTMEAYTLWWNGGNFKELLHLNEKVVPHAEWHEIKLVKQLTGQQQKEISLFRRHKAKLAWALVYVTSLVHNAGVLHNDLSPVNILLHYPPFSDEEINIGICDWGIASRIQEGAPSHFGYEKQEKLDVERMGRWWAAPELFYLFGPKVSDTSLDVMKVTYKYSVKSDSYSIGKLTQRMNIEHMVEYDKDLFRNHESSRYFAMKLRELADVDVNKRPTCAQVVDLLMGKPWFMKPPEFVFRDSVLS